MPGDSFIEKHFIKSSSILNLENRNQCRRFIAINKKGNNFIWIFLIFLLFSACAPGQSVTNKTSTSGLNPSIQASPQVPTLSSTQTSMAGSTTSVATLPVNTMTQLYAVSSPEAYQVSPGDADMIQDKVYLDSVQVQISPGTPYPVLAILKGSVPTACHLLRVVSIPSALQDQVVFQAYSLIKKDQVCIQQIKPFTVAIPLQNQMGVKTYHLIINGTEYLTFEWPE